MKKLILSTILAGFVMGAILPRPLPPYPRPGKGKQPPVPCDISPRPDCIPPLPPPPTRKG